MNGVGHPASRHWRYAATVAGISEPTGRVLVLTPDLRLDGGVTNYYRTLELDRLPSVDYFFVNRPFTRTRLDKLLCGLFIFGGFLWRSWRYSVIHVNPSFNPNSFFRDWAFVLAAKIMRKKVVVFFRGWEDSFERRVDASRALSALFRLTYARADLVIVLGECFYRKLLALGLHGDVPVQIETTVADSTGLEDLDVAAKVPDEATPMTCLFMSRILEEKGVCTAIEAVACANQTLRGDMLRLVVAGEGVDRPAAERYAARRAPGAVEFVGEVRGARKSALLAGSQILLFPTQYPEGLPNVILEAMFAGLVVVSRPVGAIAEIVENERSGLITSSTDPQVYATYLVRLCRDRGLVRTIAEFNRRISRDFTTDVVRRRLLDVYSRVLGDAA
ncbi:MAG: glycosyltransferase family 4 protein [Pseudomonadales bacterium]